MDPFNSVVVGDGVLKQLVVFWKCEGYVNKRWGRREGLKQSFGRYIRFVGEGVGVYNLWWAILQKWTKFRWKAKAQVPF